MKNSNPMETSRTNRLPKSVKRVDIIALGRARLIVPAGEGWDSWFDGEGVTADFMQERDQPVEQRYSIA